jgi:hypothetical protein
MIKSPTWNGRHITNISTWARLTSVLRKRFETSTRLFVPILLYTGISGGQEVDKAVMILMRMG